MRRSPDGWNAADEGVVRIGSIALEIAFEALRGDRQTLTALAQDSSFADGLRYASPELHSALQGPMTDSIASSIAAYAGRAAFRTTAFGSFTGISTFGGGASSAARLDAVEPVRSDAASGYAGIASRCELSDDGWCYLRETEELGSPMRRRVKSNALIDAARVRPISLDRLGSAERVAADQLVDSGFLVRSAPTGSRLDALARGRFTLQAGVCDEYAAACDVYARASGAPTLDAWRRSFERRFGVGVAVPIRVAISRVDGAGPVELARVASLARSEWLWERYRTAVPGGSMVLTADHPDDDTRRRQPLIESGFEVMVGSSDEIRLRRGALQGVPGVGRTLAGPLRAHLPAWVARNADLEARCAREDGCERYSIVFGGALRSAALAAPAIDGDLAWTLDGTPAPNARRCITSNDVALFSDGDRLHLYDLTNGAPFVAAQRDLRRLPGASLESSLMRILACNERGLGMFDWGPLTDAPFKPEVVVGRTVMSPKEWRLGRLTDRLSVERALHRADLDHPLPRYASLVVNDGAMPLDLQSEFGRHMLLRLSRPNEVARLRDDVPLAASSIVTSQAGHHHAEWIVSLTAGASRVQAPRPFLSRRTRRRRFVGSPESPPALYPGSSMRRPVPWAIDRFDAEIVSGSTERYESDADVLEFVSIGHSALVARLACDAARASLTVAERTTHIMIALLDASPCCARTLSDQLVDRPVPRWKPTPQERHAIGRIAGALVNAGRLRRVDRDVAVDLLRTFYDTLLLACDDDRAIFVARRIVRAALHSALARANAVPELIEG